MNEQNEKTLKLSMFEELMAIQVSQYIKQLKTQKNSFDYLPWADAIELASRYDSNFEWDVERFNGLNDNPVPFQYFEGLGYMVWTTCTIKGVTKKMFLPVLDNANRPLMREPYTIKTKYGENKVDKCNILDINNTIMRCLVKNIASFGLGLRVYQGKIDIEMEANNQITNQNTSFQGNTNQNVNPYGNNYQSQQAVNNYGQDYGYQAPIQETYAQNYVPQEQTNNYYNPTYPSQGAVSNNAPSQAQLDFIRNLYSAGEIDALIRTYNRTSLENFTKEEISGLINNRTQCKAN